MKIAYISDLHSEFKNRNNLFDEINKNTPDIIAIAGDLISGASNVIHELIDIKHRVNCPILYVPGNHEYYGYKYTTEVEIFNKNYKSMVDRDIFILNKKTVTINGINFIGASAFPDHSNYPIDKVSFLGYNDFHYIQGFTEKHMDWGILDRRFIKNNLSKSKPNVVITHWLPIIECISPKYKTDRYNPCFSNNWINWIVDKDIPLWIHGHSHEAFDIEISGTRFVRNPVGYPHEVANHFNINAIIEI